MENNTPPAVTYEIVRRPVSSNDGNLASVVGKARTLKGARRIRDRRDTEYGASVHGIRDNTGRYHS